MGQPRPYAVYGLMAMAVVLLVWMLLERDRLSQCSEILSSRETEPHDLSDKSMKQLYNMIKSSISANAIKNETKNSDKWNYNWDR